MNKTYFIAPFLLLLVFVGFYATHQSGYEKREAARVAKVEADLKAKNDAEQVARKTAMQEAVKAAELRKVEKAAKEAKDKAAKEARQLAVDARDKAFRDQERAGKNLDRLAKDIEAEQAAIAKITAGRKAAEAEKAFLVDFVTKAQANVQALQGLLTKLNTPPPAPAPVAAK
jgi:flagellar biosynthesis GTPase FlhF